MAAIQFNCSECGQVMKAPETAAGRKGRCKACGNVERVPRPLICESGDYRPHHYAFAHGLVPAFSLLSGPEGTGTLLAMCVDPSGDFARKSWRMAGEDLPRDQRLSPEGLKATMVEVDDSLGLAMVRLPPARFMAEAIYVVGVYQKGRGRKMDFRLLTLELSYGPSTMLCEWAPTREGGLNHVNHGPGSPDSETALVKAIRQIL